MRPPAWARGRGERPAAARFALTLPAPPPTLARVWCSRAPLRHAQLNGKQGACLHRSRANLCCPRNGKRTRRAQAPRSAASPHAMRMRTTATGCDASGKAKRRVRQPGYRPKRWGSAPRGGGASSTAAAGPTPGVRRFLRPSAAARARPARRTAGGAGEAGGSRVGIHDVDRSQGSTMPDPLFRLSRGCPRGSRGDLPARRPMNCHAATDATIPS